MAKIFPEIIINFKIYTEGFGKAGHRIAEAAEMVMNETGVIIGIAPGYMDLHPMSMHYSLPVYAQHIDPVKPGAGTGHILAEAVASAGACGTLINHSEKRLTLADVSLAVEIAKSVHLETIVCTNDVFTSAAAASFSPEFIAIEPPELIGSGVSVSTADPGIIENSVSAVKNISSSTKVLAGAGIHSGNCIKTAMELGADGVLLASGVVKAKDPYAVLTDLAGGVI